MATRETGSQAPELRSLREAEASSTKPAPKFTAARSDAHPGPSSPEGQVQAEQSVPEIEMTDSVI